MNERGADIQMTRAMIDGAGPLGISVRDHIIVGKNGHASMKNVGILHCVLNHSR
jgi:DNA repair protein RadC